MTTLADKATEQPTLKASPPPHVTTRIERAEPEAIARLGLYSSATIHEAQGRRGALASSIKPIDREMTVVGSAFTVVCAPRDNLMLQVAIHYAQPGDVLLVSTAQFTEAGIFGGVLASACAAKGIAGLITDGSVRDTAELRALGLPIFSAGISIQGTVKETLGPLNQPLTIGGQTVRPGDVLKGDADGVVVVRREEVEEATTASQRRDEHEAELVQLYRAGRTTIDLCGLEHVLEAKGMTTDLPGRGW
ncbi:4-carboxy-4-hydroxy-2-oxoadipate aldolase/oxaloacetate decarboxylase [Kineococcus sp. G2]|uniref:4-carboxy-4-hydroxy-2-oxoadipate aldolase/oxaloacetate decarboxylase n=1 Tax=Kineococcus sp. G2 TaxID=3127484 RepID=UPI00301C56B2